VAADGALADPDPRVRRVAAHVLGDLDPASARDPLLACLRDDDGEVRAIAIASLAAGGTPEALPTIVALLDDPDVSVRRAVVTAVASIDPRPDIVTSAIHRMLEDPDTVVRSRAAAVLAAEGDAAARSILVELAGSDADVDRVAAFRAMRGLSVRALADLAEAGFSDPVPAVRSAHWRRSIRRARWLRSSRRSPTSSRWSATARPRDWGSWATRRSCR
jgi:HEAT repeat protein